VAPKDEIGALDSLLEGVEIVHVGLDEHRSSLCKSLGLVPFHITSHSEDFKLVT